MSSRGVLQRGVFFIDWIALCWTQWMPLLLHVAQWTFLLPINLPSPRWNPQSFNQTNIPLLNTASSCANAIWGLLRTICVQQCLFCIYIGTEDNWGPAASKASTNGQHHDVGNLLIKTNCAKVTTWNNTRRSLAARQQDSWHGWWLKRTIKSCIPCSMPRLNSKKNDLQDHGTMFNLDWEAFFKGCCVS